ncbi:ABC transporter ATP-binding protein [Vallitalea okinawensis]|uniref:ABC transporter ATP-binding protein n=1 Tax=Vallitalea okinawensis TaxID=2078660 RepID=UPI000CFB3AD7|nr:ABC transporter ATP-binding protein [Vallitalea okinawensis]
MNIDIVVKDVHKHFGIGDVKVEVLKGIDMKIKKGEFISIMGPSGSGKSTLLYLIGGLDQPTEGNVFIKEQDIHQLSDKQESEMRRRDIGFVFQFYNLVPNFNVEENVMLPVLLDGGKKKNYKDKLEEVLGIVELGDRKKHTPRELSGGQQQRVAIARALMNDPDIILADEPIGNLDSHSGTNIMELFQKINKEHNKTIVQVTHSHRAALYGSRIINIKDGVIFKDEKVN